MPDSIIKVHNISSLSKEIEFFNGSVFNYFMKFINDTRLSDLKNNLMFKIINTSENK